MVIFQRTQTHKALAGFKFLPVIVFELANNEVQQQFDIQNDLLHQDFVVAALLSPSFLVYSCLRFSKITSSTSLPLLLFFRGLMCGVTGISHEDELLCCSSEL